MSKPILALIPSGYKEDKVYSILPNDATGDFDFTRASKGTRVRKDGLIEEIGVGVNDVPRLDWFNSSCPSLLLESQRTNLQVYSEDYSNAAWNKIFTTVTSNDILAPNGEYTADRVTRTTTSSNFVSDVISKPSASVLKMTTSVFVKQGNSDFIAFRSQGSYPARFDARFQFSTESLTTSVGGTFVVSDSKVEDYGNGWYKLSVSYETDSSSTLINYFTPRATSGNVDGSDTSTDAFAYFWGIQVEQGAYASSYIKTEASSVTRSRDNSFNGGDSNLFDSEEITFFVDVTPYKADAFHYISLNDGSNQNRIIFIFNDGNTSYTARIISSGTTELNDTENITFDTRNKIAISIKENDAKVYLNGSSVASDTSFNMPVDLDRLNFSIYANTGNFFEGKVHDIRVYNSALSSSELIELTTL